MIDRRHHRIDAQEGVRARRRLAGLGALREDRGARARGARGVGGALCGRGAGGRRAVQPRRRTRSSPTLARQRDGLRRPVGHHRRRATTDRRAEDADRLARLVEAAWTVLDRLAASAPAELRKGPRGGGRDRDKMLAHVVEAEWSYAREMGITVKQPDSGGPGRRRRDARRDARGAARAVGRFAAGRTDDGRRATPRAGSPGTRSTTPGRWRTGATRADASRSQLTGRPVRGHRGPVAPWPRPPARSRPPRSDPPPAGRAPRWRRRPSTASARRAGGRARDGRTSPGRPGRAAARAGSGPRSRRAGRDRGRRGPPPGAGRRRRPRRRTSSGRPGRGSAGRRRPATSSEHGPTSASIQRSDPPPSAARRTGPVEAALAAAARAAGSVPATAVRGGPRLERRPRAVAAVDEDLVAEAVQRRRHMASSSSDWRTGPSSGENPSQARSSSSAASYSGRQRVRSWSSIRSRTAAPAVARQPPDPDGVRDVAEVEVAGRRRRIARPRRLDRGRARHGLGRTGSDGRRRVDHRLGHREVELDGPAERRSQQRLEDSPDRAGRPGLPRPPRPRRRTP